MGIYAKQSHKQMSLSLQCTCNLRVTLAKPIRVELTLSKVERCIINGSVFCRTIKDWLPQNASVL